MSELRYPTDRPSPEDGAADDPMTEVIPDVKTGTMTVVEVTSLVNLFNTMLLAMEGRLSGKIEATARAADERWRLHDLELERNRKTIVDRFEKIENSMLTVEKSLKTHLDREHDEQVAIDARVKPVKSTIGWLWAHWRDLLLLFIGLIAAGTFFLDWLTHVFDGTMPGS